MGWVTSEKHQTGALCGFGQPGTVQQALQMLRVSA
jgi:hypothetical protein